MTWPFTKRQRTVSRAAEISALRREVSTGRDKVYSELFKLDKTSNALDDLVKRSLALLESDKK